MSASLLTQESALYVCILSCLVCYHYMFQLLLSTLEAVCFIILIYSVSTYVCKSVRQMITDDVHKNMPLNVAVVINPK